MDLPTYTNIWRIEKRLYKLYDLRLPMPLPLGQIVAFAGITVPYILFLTLIGMPFNHNLFWLYVLPPWALTWLATRPVLENKRLPELLVSQVRYLGEPRVWCRMAPAAEKEEITVTGRVWHARRRMAPQPVALEAVPSRSRPPLHEHGRPGQPKWARPEPAPRRRVEPRHRKAGAPQPQPAMATARRMRVRYVPVGPAFPAGPGPAGRPVLAGPVLAGPGPAGRVPGGPVPAGPPAAGSPVPWARRGRAPVPDGRAAAPEGRPHAAAPRVAATGEARAAATGGPAAAAQGPGPAALRARGPAGPWEYPASAPSARPARRQVQPAPAAAHVGQRPEWATRARPGSSNWRVVATGPRLLEVAHAEKDQWTERKAPRPGWEPKQPPIGGPVAPASPSRPGAAPASFGVPAPDVPAPDVAGERWRPGGPKHAGPPARPAAAQAVACPVSAQEARPATPAASEVLPAPAHPPTRPVPGSPPALTGPGDHIRHDQVTIVLSRGAPDAPAVGEQEERDRALARMPLPGPRRIVVVGCTSGAGQTVTALLTARMLASLRAEPVGALDLNPGDGSLTRRSQREPAGTVPDLLGTALPASPAPGVEVICTGVGQPGEDGRDGPGGPGGPGGHDFARIGERLAARYGLCLIDPGAAGLARVLSIADQLVLVAPASGDAPRAVAMTRKWLDAHGHHELAANAVLVVNGVSSRTLADVEEAEAIALGRCRAIVRVPWEDQFGSDGGPCAGAAPLSLPARQAITELAGVLVSGLAGSGPPGGPGDRR